MPWTTSTVRGLRRPAPRQSGERAGSPARPEPPDPRRNDATSTEDVASRAPERA